MLRIRNNDIELTRGENAQISISVWDKDGKPYVMPRLPDGMYPVIAFTVRSGSYDSIVLALYLDMNAHPVFAGKTDYGGWAKFSSQMIKETSKSTLDLATAKGDEPEHYVYHSVADGVDIYQHGIVGLNGSVTDIAPYAFEFAIAIDHRFTANLEAKDYVYDVILYYGKLKEGAHEPEFTDFPLSDIVYKKELIAPHKFTLGDTNNA